MASGRSTVVVANIHCPSCVSTITDILTAYRPSDAAPPSTLDDTTPFLTAINVSLITGIVSFDSATPLTSDSLRDIVQDLAAAGFEVVSTSTDDATTSVHDATQGRSEVRHAPSATKKEDAGPPGLWTRLFESKEERKRREAHEAHCSACQAAKARAHGQSVLHRLKRSLSRGNGHPAKSDLEKDRDQEDAESVASSIEDKGKAKASPKASLLETKFIVGGMTCASCVGALNNALSPESLHGVQSASVTLVPPIATIVHSSDLSVSSLKEAITDVGYDAELVSSLPLDSPELSEIVTSPGRSQPRVRAILAIEGMSCASCVGSITRAVSADSIPGVIDFEVGLIGGRGVLTATDKNVVAKVRTEIEDIGFDCTVVEVVDVLPNDAADDIAPERTVRVRIEGMYCSNCTDKLVSIFDSFAPSSLSYTPFTDREPSTTLNYRPSAPSFTLRTIAKAVQAEGFGLVVTTDNTIESRAKLAQQRERARILIRLGITFLAAIPTFIINVVGMSLVGSNHGFRKYWDHQIWGGAARGTVAMWIIATPIQFGIGWFFYERAWKSLRGVWRRRRPGQKRGQVWKARLLRWGSMDTLVSLGTSVAYFASVAFMVLDITAPRDNMAMGDSGSESDSVDMGYFDTCVLLMFFILCGRYLEARAKASTGDAIDELNKMKPARGTLYNPGAKDGEMTTEEVDASMIEVGDVLLVPSGSSPCLDGQLIDSSSSSNFEESSLTGESRPVAKGPGDDVFAGTINLGPSAVLVKVTKGQGSTMLDGIVTVVRDAMGKKAGVERIADQVTAYFVPAAVGIATFSFVVWIMRGYLGNLPRDWLDNNGRGGWVLFAVQFGVAALVVACPCGIGLAAPTAQMVGTGLAARNGILPHGGGEAFESANQTKVVVLDKTGTISVGSFSVTNELLQAPGDGVAPAYGNAFIHRAVELVEQASSHPISVGVQQHCSARLAGASNASIPLTLVESEEIPGRGLVGVVEGNEGDRYQVLVGNEKLLHERASEYAPTLSQTAVKDAAARWQSEAKSTVFVGIASLHDEEPMRPLVSAVFAVQDPPRPEAATVINELRKAGIAVWMITGDNEVTARAVAGTVGIDDECVVAGALPTDKKAAIERLQRGQAATAIERSRWSKWLRFGKAGKPLQRAKVLFVGDGINDAPGLAQADVGVAMGSGASIAHSSASFVLLSNSLLPLLTLLQLSTKTMWKIKSNFAWALVYNVILIPLAAGAFYDAGRTRLPPIWASLAMALSSVSVVVNSLFLRWTYRPPKAVVEYTKGPHAGTA